jgi:hypothetical protein
MLLETSADGLAFAWRGGVCPQVGTLIELLEDTAGGTARSERAVVRRSSNCHDDLNVIAVQMIQTRPFPPRPALAAATGREVDLTPVVCARFRTSERCGTFG